MIRYLLTFALVASALSETGCGQSSKECTVPDGVDPDWIRVIRCERDYELLVTERDDAIFSQTQTLNWLIDREDGDRLYFIDSETWELHYYFADAYLQREGLTPVGTHGEFNLLNYRREGRRFVLGKVVRYAQQELLTLEFSAGDTAGVEMIVDAYERVSSALYDGRELVYRPLSQSQEALIPELEQHIPTIATEEVFLGQSYQALNQVEGYGYLRFRRIAELGARPVAPTDIVVLDRVPNDLSLVSGIVTDEFQTPLAHVNLLSKNRGTPNMALRGAFEDEALRALDGALVRIEVGPQSYEIREASLGEAEAYWESLRPGSELVPSFDLSIDEIVDLGPLGMDAVSSIGAKAANLAEMSLIEGEPIPLPRAPVAVPFSWYHRHLERHGLDQRIAELLAEVDAGSLSDEELRASLFELRWDIFQAELEPEDLVALRAELLARYGAETRLRFRSSTNVEDLEEFSGAGLYTSASASLDEGDAAIANAVKVVWASAWNHQAFVERAFYKVQQEAVYMGVLVHPAFEDEAANGVAVTINEFASNRPAFFINSQAGEVSVTNPTGLAIPEQLLYYTWYEEPEVEVITRSSLLDGEAVMSADELEALATALERIHAHFRRLYPPREDFAMDVEFKLDRDRKLVIKQARPLAVH